MNLGHMNLQFAWFGVVAGILSGVVLGMNLQREDWLGGYCSLKRRMYRLAHISLFGLAMLNFMFFLTVDLLSLLGAGVMVASWGFLIGAVSMPVCCVVMAHFPRTLPLFAVPVVSLIAGGVLTAGALVASHSAEPGQRQSKNAASVQTPAKNRTYVVSPVEGACGVRVLE